MQRITFGCSLLLPVTVLLAFTVPPPIRPHTVALLLQSHNFSKRQIEREHKAVKAPAKNLFVTSICSRRHVTILLRQPTIYSTCLVCDCWRHEIHCCFGEQNNGDISSRDWHPQILFTFCKAAYSPLTARSRLARESDVWQQGQGHCLKY